MTTALAKLAALHAPSPSQESGLAFARELEGCIRAVAAATAASAPYWADHCVAPSNKVAFQAQRLTASLSPVLRRHGYGAAHWCAFYAANMPHGWPYSPRFFGYTFVCPELYGHRTCRADAPLAALGDESRGVALERVGPARAYRVEMYGMSCALCAELRRRLGAPPYVLPTAVDHDARYRRMGLANASAGWVNLWDVHTFGLWLATELWPSQRADPSAALEEIHRYRISNGEEIHAFLWGSMALLAEHEPPGFDPLPWVVRACDRSFALDARGPNAESMWECAHGAGHGFYMFYKNGTRAVAACQDARLRDAWRLEIANRTYHREGELWAFWKRVCFDGVWHTAFNKLDVPALRRLDAAGARTEADVKQQLCGGQPGCALSDKRLSGEAGTRLRLVADGECDAFDEPALKVAAERDEKTHLPACADEPRWTNGFGLGCGDYVSKGYCMAGRVLPGHEWVAGERFGNPEGACCACGRGQGPRPSPSPPRVGSPPPPGAPPPPPKVARNRTVAAARTAGAAPARKTVAELFDKYRGKYVGGAKREGGGAVSVFDIEARHGLPWG